MKFPLEILSLFLLVAGTLTQGKFVFENIGRFRLWHGLHYDYMKSERLKPYTEKLKYSHIKATDSRTIYQTLFISLMF